MDGLSGAASVIAVIQIAQTIGSALKDYYEGVRDARADIQKLYYSVRSLESILSDIQDIINRSDGERLLGSSLFTNSSGPLRQLELELHKLRLELNISATTKHGIGKALQSLTWPFKKKDVEKAVDTIDQHKSSLILEIGVENFDATSRIFDISADIRSEIRSARDEGNRRRIVAWLSKGVPDPSKDHNLARERHEATTGSWLIDGNKFKIWTSSKNSLLWLNGGAGAGKSILCSTVIDTIQKNCKNEPGTAVVYWYFTFTDTEKQNVSNFLCSIVADICSNRRDTPLALQEAYDQANYGQQRPEIKSIMAMLNYVAVGFEHIYLIVDALDECPKSTGERSKLLNAIHEIHGWKMNSLHILATSRGEVDIEESFSCLDRDLGCYASVGVQGIHVEQDIIKYIQHRLEHRDYQKWKSALKRDVEIKLASQANGMFRLVALQLDALSKLRAESKIRVAMEQLPKTLDEFYDRILRGIEEPDQELAYLAMQWLAFSARPVSLRELAEAVIIRRDDEPYVNNEDRFLDYKDMLEILPSGLVSSVINDEDLEENYLDSDGGSELDSDIVNASNDEERGSKIVDEQVQRTEQSKALFEDEEEVDDKGRTNDIKSNLMVQFAHFSVKEYLISNRPKLKYQIDEISANEVIAESCFAYLIYVGIQEPGIQEPAITVQLFTNFPLLNYAAKCWPYHVHILQSQNIDGQCLKLALRFLQKDSFAWRVWAVVEFDDHASFDVLENIRSPVFWDHFPPRLILIHPISWVSGFGFSHLLKHLLVESVYLNKIPQTPNIGNPLHISACNGHLQVVKMLLAAGSNLNRNGGEYGYALQAASYMGHQEIVCLLLEAGANVHAQGGYYGNALQAASYEGHQEIVCLLLGAGADVNTQGGEYGYALQAASYKGHQEVVRLLLEAGADVNAQGGEYSYTLQAASVRGYTEIVRLLLQAGADINAQGGHCGYALQVASTYGSIEIVRLLLQAGADINAQGGHYGYALQAASAYGSIEIVRLLLQAGADINAQGGHYGYALQAASLKGYTEIVRLLLQAGADVHAQGGYYGNAIRAAETRGWNDVVQLLLDSGAKDRPVGLERMVHKKVEEDE